VAVAEASGPAEALPLVDELPLSDYYLFHSTRGELLARLRRSAEAAAAFEQARDLATNDAERGFLERRLQETSQRVAGGGN
jgi:RNA polymerase sigma-70 factor (ECF subfamily)